MERSRGEEHFWGFYSQGSLACVQVDGCIQVTSTFDSSRTLLHRAGSTGSQILCKCTFALQQYCLGISGSMALSHHTMTGWQINQFFILAEYTVTLALLLDVLPGFDGVLSPSFPMYCGDISLFCFAHMEFLDLRQTTSAPCTSVSPASLSEQRCPNSPWCSARRRDYQLLTAQTS